jgi:two-component system NtrC family sensor kinase
MTQVMMRDEAGLESDLGQDRPIAAMLAHEVNGILTPALAYTQLARRPGADDQAVARALESAEQSILRTTEIVRVILALGRDEAIRSRARCDAHEVAARAALGLEHSLEHDGVGVRNELPMGTSVAISASVLHQVLANLMQNAASALAAAGTRQPEIRLGVTRPERSTGNMRRVWIEVTDNGPGVPEALRDRMFEPFERGADDRLGSGLGLTICRELLALADGTIEYAPRPGVPGARFVLSLPRA